MLVVGAAAARPADPAGAPVDLAATYLQLQQWRCSAQPLRVPTGGIRFDDELASFVLESGQIRLLEPTSAGVWTGLSFEGRGHFTMTVPDPVERTQLARFARRPALSGIDQPFSSMLLRASGPVLAEEFTAAAAAGPFGPCPRVAERQISWLTIERSDVDARVVAGLADGRDRYLRAELETVDFGRLLYEFDALRQEEISLRQLTSAGGFPFLETWLSLDRAKDRQPSGRPGSARREPFSIPHVELAVELLRTGRETRQGWSDTDEVKAHIVATLAVRGGEGNARTLSLALHPEAQVASITADDGNGKVAQLQFLRDRIGARSATLQNWLHDSGLLVLLDRPLPKGEERRLTVTYDLNLANYAPGRTWYPSLPERSEPHTARLTLTVPEKREVRAMGALLSETSAGGRVTTAWEIAVPTRMVTFSFAENFREERVELEGAPAIVAFASRTGTSKNRLWNVAADVANCVGWMQQLLGSPLGGEQLYATSILAGHGQSFEGFLHLSEATFVSERRGPTELFRCHEAAHQWWGHRVGFATYRDQWLSEAFAEYSALMFLEAQPKDGPELLQEALDAAAAGLFGSIKGALSRFARPGMIVINDHHRGRLGPISLGYRASTGEIPFGYQLQSYQKGALVLHMLRTLLRNVSGSDELFIALLRDFVAGQTGREASTADLVAALTRRAPGDWSWFFDQWVDGTAIPEYRWSYSLAPAAAGGGTVLTLRVRQSGVPDGFRMPVPVRLDYAGGKRGQVVVGIDRPDETFTIQLSDKPSRVVFNPGHAVLATVKRD